MISEGRGGQQEGLIWQHLIALTQQDTSVVNSHGSTCLGLLEIMDTLGLEPTSLRLLPPVVRDFRFVLLCLPYIFYY